MNRELYRTGGGWGDAINWTDWDKRRVVGWKDRKPEPGDLLHAEMESGKTAVLVFEEVKPCWNPPDMFFATLRDAGYLDDPLLESKIEPAPQPRRWSFHDAQYRLHTFCGYAAIVGFAMVAYVVLCDLYAR